MRFAVGDSLFPALEVGQAAFGLVLACVQSLALAEDVGALALKLALDVGAVLDGRLLGLDLGFAPERFGLLPGFGDDQLPRTARGSELVARERDQDEPRGQGSDDEADQDSHQVRHRSSSGRQSVPPGWTRARPGSKPARALANRSKRRRRPPAEAHIKPDPCLLVTAPLSFRWRRFRFRVRWSDSESASVQTNCRVVLLESQRRPRSLCNVQPECTLDE